MLTDFQTFFTDRLSSKRVMNWSLKILPHLKCVATLPCEMQMSGNYQNLKQMSRLTINFNFISYS